MTHSVWRAVFEYGIASSSRARRLPVSMVASSAETVAGIEIVRPLDEQFLRAVGGALVGDGGAREEGHLG
jgi:hypothetical protein